ncbi:MAG TPA: RNA polymerase sigma factor [Gemmatimonadales bacterium]|nr:RNA polymerase sigma factor [Gemmatimonadales bacterium]
MIRHLSAETAIASPHDELGALARSVDPGDPATFTALARRILAPVRNLAIRLTGDADEADDIAQLVLIRLHRQVESFEGRSRFTTWLHRLTVNVIHDRRTTERRRAALRDAHRHELATGHHEADPVALDAAALADLVKGCQVLLTPREREVFRMIDLEGRDTASVAAELRIAPSTARVLLARARRRIRLEMLAEHPQLLKEYLP